MDKNKIINDPVHGFIRLSGQKVFNIIDHPDFQRLRSIKQLGLTNLVYPGALHTRFQHAIGAYHLTTLALETLILKGVEITEEESEATKLAILLHDIGHGPFSHALESTLLQHIHHEEVTLLFMEKLNQEFNGDLDLAISIFKGLYHKKFLNQLISSQLDMDRMDYLKRDSFFTGVYEANIGSERIIMMLNVMDNELVMDEKAIFSIEKFLMSRRFMYWQVYLHKTVIGAENHLVKILRRAKELKQNGEDLFCLPNLLPFLSQDYSLQDFQINSNLLNIFAQIDDGDIYACIKQWTHHPDKVLSFLSKNLLNRKLFNTKLIVDKSSSLEELEIIKSKVAKDLNIPLELTSYFVFTDEVSNTLYNNQKQPIKVLTKSGQLIDFDKLNDVFSSSIMTQTLTKYFCCYPKNYQTTF